MVICFDYIINFTLVLRLSGGLSEGVERRELLDSWLLGSYPPKVGAGKIVSYYEIGLVPPYQLISNSYYFASTGNSLLLQIGLLIVCPCSSASPSRYHPNK